MNLKRLWDTENKKAVWAMPAIETQAEVGRWNPMQVWTNDDGSKLYVYSNSQYQEIFLSGTIVETYGPVWKSLTDEEVGYYLTNEPTDLYSWDSGDEAAYRFMNGTTVLQSGKVDEGETPEYTGDTPTKPTDTHIYTFSGWKPTVGPIYKKTDFKAQFTATPVPTLVNSIEAMSETSADVLTDGEGNYIDVSIEINQEDSTVVASPHGIFADERYVIDRINVWEDLFVYTMGVERVQSMIEYATEFPENIFAAMNTYYNNPTVENSQSLADLLAGWDPTPLPELENEVFPYETDLSIFGDTDADSNVVVGTETDPETGDNIVVVTPLGVFENDVFVGTYGEENQNGWEYIFVEALVVDDLVHLTYEGEGATDGEWKSGVWSALQTYYETPTKVNADAVITAIVATRDGDTGQLEPITWTIPEPTLLTYSELVALGTHEAILAELNTNKEGYYASLTAEGHIQVQEAPEGEEGSVGILVDGNGNETVIDFYAYAYIISSPDEEHIPSKTWVEQERPN